MAINLSNDIGIGSYDDNDFAFIYNAPINTINNIALNLNQLEYIELSQVNSSITTNAFSNCSNLKRIVLPGNLNLNDKLFGENCSSLTSISFADNATLTSLENVFKDTPNCTNIELPETISSLGNSLFMNITSDTFTNIDIPSNVSSIGTSCFANCSSLIELNFQKVRSIGEKAFANCSSLQFINGISNLVGVFNLNSVTGCSSLQELHIPSGCTNTSFDFDSSYNLVSMNSLIIDASNCTEIGNISNLNALTSLVLSAISKESFTIALNNPQLQVFDQPRIKNFQYITGLNNCPNIKNIVFHQYSSGVQIKDTYLKNNTNIRKITFDAGDNEYFNIDSIDDQSFAGMTSLTQLDMLNVRKNDNSTIWLDDVSNLISGNISLTSFMFPSNLTQIPNGFLTTCTNLNTVVFPDNLQMIDLHSTLDSLTQLTYINLNLNAITEVKENGLYKTDGGIRINNSDSNQFTGSNLTSIGAYAFANVKFQQQTELTSLTSTNLMSIGNYAFASCDNLTKINIPVNNCPIGVCQNCASLQSVSFASDTTSIGLNAFNGCMSLISVEVPSTATINDNAFANCNMSLFKFSGDANNLKTKILNNSKCTIIELNEMSLSDFNITGQNAYQDLKDELGIANDSNPVFKLKDDVILTKDIDISYPDCFIVENLKILKNIDITKTSFANISNDIQITSYLITTISANALNDAIEIHNQVNNNYDNVKLTFGQNIIYVQNNTKFAQLTSVNLDNYKTTTPLTAWGFGSNLKNIRLLDHYEHINNEAFKDLTGLTSLIAPYELTSINSNAFNGANSLTSLYINTSRYNELNLLSDSFNGSNVKQLRFTDIGRYYFVKNGGQFQYISESAQNSNNQKFNVGTLIWTAENPVRENPVFIVTNKYKHYYEDDDIISYGTGKIEQVNGTTVKYIERALSVDANGIVCSCDNFFMPLNGRLPDYALYNLSGVAQYAFKTASLLKQIVIPEELSTSIGDYAFDLSSNDELIVRMNWCTYDEYMRQPRLSNAINDWGLSSSPIAYIELKDYKIFSDNSRLSNGDIFTWITMPDPNNTSSTSSEDQFYDIIVKYHPEYDNYNASCIEHSITIPDRFDAIAAGAFDKSTESYLTSLNLNKVVNVGANAFAYNSKLSSIDIPNVKYIGENAFAGTSITSIVFPSSLSLFADYGLRECRNLEQIRITNNITAIANDTLRNAAPSLASIIVEDNEPLTNIISIGDYAFHNDGQANLTTFQNIGTMSNLTSIGMDSFYSVKLQNATLNTSLDRLTTINDYSFYNTAVESISLSSAKEIKEGAFSKSNELTSINLGTNVSSIGNYAFADCKKHFDVNIPSTIKEIGYNAFRDWVITSSDASKKVLTADILLRGAGSSIGLDKVNDGIIVDEYYDSDNVFGLSDETIISCLRSNQYQNFAFIYDGKMKFCPRELQIDILQKKLVSIINEPWISSVTIPKYIENLGQGVLSDNEHLQTLNLYQTTEPTAYTFYNARNLVQLHDPEVDGVGRSLTSLYEHEFDGCNKLNNLTVSPDVVDIPQYAFADCWSLANNVLQANYYDESLSAIVRQNNITSIGSYAFANCSSLTSLYYPNTISKFGEWTLSGCNGLRVVYVDLSAQQFIGNISAEDPSLDTLPKIFSHAFHTSDQPLMNHKYVVQFIKENAKYYDSETGEEYQNGIIIDPETNKIVKLIYDQFVLNEVYLSSFSGVNEFVFTNCNKLTALVSYNPNELTGDIGQFAFKNCTKLKYFNTSDKSIGYNPNYMRCRSIGRYAFYNCRSLNSIEIDCANLEKIDVGAFYGCQNLIELRFTNYQEDASQNLSILKQIIGQSISNLNPMQLNENCRIIVEHMSNGSTIVMQYDYLLNDITTRNVDTNINSIVFTDKTPSSVKALLLVPTAQGARSSVIAANTFNCNIIGRYK